MDELMTLMDEFQVEQNTEVISQLKSSPKYITDTFFTRKEGIEGHTATIKIKRGAGVILTALTPEANRQVDSTKDEYIIKTEIPRFALTKTLNVSEIKSLKAFDNKNDALESLSMQISNKLKEQKLSLTTTLEFLCLGALNGIVYDGEGKELFKIEKDSSVKPIELKGTLDEYIREIEEKLSDELGYIPEYKVLADNKFIGKLVKVAEAEGLFKNSCATWQNNNNKRELVIYGTIFTPYNAKYNNSKGTRVDFLSDSAKVIPYDEEVFKIIYGSSMHTQAINQLPTLFFASSPTENPQRTGWNIDSEMNALPVCTRPEAVFELKITDAYVDSLKKAPATETLATTTSDDTLGADKV